MLQIMEAYLHMPFTGMIHISGESCKCMYFNKTPIDAVQTCQAGVPSCASGVRQLSLFVLRFKPAIDFIVTKLITLAFVLWRPRVMALSYVFAYTFTMPIPQPVRCQYSYAASVEWRFSLHYNISVSILSPSACRFNGASITVTEWSQ